MAPRTPIPIALRRAIDARALAEKDPCDSLIMLGSFWPNSRTSYESLLVKSFKECHPTAAFEPRITQLCRFYADLIIDAVKGEHFDWVARVLSSSEKEPENSRPQSMLADMLCARTGARGVTHLFFKTEQRPSMRNVKRLCGPDALDARIAYVLQDLFIIPHHLGGKVLLLDDIYNLGASCRVYSRALKNIASAQSVCAVNLAATRFRQGKDGHGMLKLNISALSDAPEFAQVWLDDAGLYHSSADCPQAAAKNGCAVRFVAERKAKPCSACFADGRQARKWWRFGL